MHPVLFKIGPLELYSYGLMMAVAFFVSISWGARRAPRYHISAQFMENLSWVIIIAGVVGGRAGYLLIEESASDFFSLKFFEFWKGGMVYYGGLILVAITGWFYCRKEKASFFDVVDIVAPCLALGHAIGRLGCLLAGCCYGKVCEWPWAITFTDPRSLAPLNIRIHPTQLYELLGNLMIVGILILIERFPRFRGQIFAIYLVLYGVLRGTVEIYRGDTERGFVDFNGLYPNEWLSTSTFISIAMFVVAALIFVFNRKNPSPSNTKLTKASKSKRQK